MGEVLALAERFWQHGATMQDLWRVTRQHEEIAPDVFFLHTWANVTLVRTPAGLILVDTGNFVSRARTFELVRSIDERPVAAAVYTHGHVDHACGLSPFLAEAAEKRRPPPRIVGHRNIAARFDRYRATGGYNALINARQFAIPPSWPAEYEYPDVVYDRTHTLDVGGVRLELNHACGETDDHTWIWWPERRILFTGDFFIWTAPNAGNPQKAQRYAAEWAAALRAMAAREPELLIPGHGMPIVGAARARQALTETAEWLEFLVTETLARMNAGVPLERIVLEVKPPAHLASRPYLSPVYDEPEYVVRNIWRLYGGWYDGVPSHLKPATEAELGREIASLAGGGAALVERARALAKAGNLALASHLIDWAVAADPADRTAHALRSEIYTTRAEHASALMTRGIFSAAARDSADKSATPSDT